VELVVHQVGTGRIVSAGRSETKFDTVALDATARISMAGSELLCPEDEVLQCSTNGA